MSVPRCPLDRPVASRCTSKTACQVGESDLYRARTDSSSLNTSYLSQMTPGCSPHPNSGVAV